MTVIYLPETAVLTDYAATAKNGKAHLTIKIEVGEPGALGYLLQDLGDIQRKQKADRPSPYQPQPKTKTERELGRALAASSRLLLITDQRGGGR